MTMALGQQIGTITGKVNSTRVLPPQDRMPVVEVSFEADGELNGVQAHFVCSYWVQIRPDGTVYGETNNQGVIVTGDGITTYSGAATGHMTPDGGSALVGAIYLHNPPGKLDSLVESAVVFEWQVDGEGNTRGVLTEWK
jgi:hypothetical protein